MTQHKLPDEAERERIRADFARLEAMCSENTPVEEEELERALREADKIAKEQMRREMFGRGPATDQPRLL